MALEANKAHSPGHLHEPKRGADISTARAPPALPN
jgi:hypothetical protein